MTNPLLLVHENAYGGFECNSLSSTSCPAILSAMGMLRQLTFGQRFAQCHRELQRRYIGIIGSGAQVFARARQIAGRSATVRAGAQLPEY